MTNWRPSASLDALAARAATLQHLRAFFAARGVMEVETPLVSLGTVTDPAIDALILTVPRWMIPHDFCRPLPNMP